MSTRVQFRCSKADRLELESRAARRDVSLSELIRQELFQREGADEAEEKQT